ncbi:hydroxymethylpyrimidine/phosphomethylpyrimidine kinase [Adhaeribacter rhizoryzae]|uniref:hydroxymethylpyrimidine kinase n=1 Tax=Adhaeribacter rhizoryzae TaxID=2607907 RepID=A0A5M6CZN9_9BACT|nr:hydroxymethylpyrimidine/phosphomethylpyrimidine kinase [Adhaeribacter rhizoryzae]KAA5540326.1 hydroxymethylpyrimidine/phosphomethylpyrimidine kinase [Adhaeribacter rhizoryzae]
MQPDRPYVLSIAGLDPSGGAGVLADVKTFEQHQVYGFGVCSALTVQSDSDFLSVKWLSAPEIIAQLEPLVTKFPLAACKIGIIQNWEVLDEVLNFLKQINPDLPIVLDPVLQASAGYIFQTTEAGWQQVLPKLSLLTPNYNEMKQLRADSSPEETALSLSATCAVLLKGGHHPAAPGTDYLFQNGHFLAFKPGSAEVFPKHGSGCVLSAAIAANLALGYALPEACRLAKKYTELFLSSTPALLGYHYL